MDEIEQSDPAQSFCYFLTAGGPCRNRDHDHAAGDPVRVDGNEDWLRIALGYAARPPLGPVIWSDGTEATRRVAPNPYYGPANAERRARHRSEDPSDE